MLLTIIIPCYNAENYFERCVSSLEKLNSEFVSVLFVNDGSDDSTEELINDWLKTHTNSHMVSKQNEGYSSAINKGLDNCSSEYVMFLGIDDEVVPEGINNICLNLMKNKPDILAFATIKQFDDEKESVNRVKDSFTSYANAGYFALNVSDLFQRIKNDAGILFSRDTSRCYKRSVIGDLRYFGKMGVSADGCFATLVALKASSFEFVNEDCYVWHIHNDSVSGRKITNARLIDEADVWKIYFSELQKTCKGINVPDPVISHLFVYGQVISQLKTRGLYGTAKNHSMNYTQLIKWFRKNCHLSGKSLLKTWLPTLYSLFYDIKRAVHT